MVRGMFFRAKTASAGAVGGDASFGYMPEGVCYLDSACQTMRPRAVIDAETEYYLHYNACGGRVKYRWGRQVDDAVAETRRRLLAYAGKNEKDYCVAFTLNTTYGVNLLLHQLPEDGFDRIVTSEIEHNSVMLPTMTWARKRGVDRRVLPRSVDGSLEYQAADVAGGVVILNSLSNIDGRAPGNLRELSRDVHASGGLLLIDAAQGFAHDPERLHDVDFDAAFGSGHKMYGPSIGFIVLKRSLLDRLQPFFIGGGTVTDVDTERYALLREGEEAHAVLEPGLQNWGGIIGLGAAVQWIGAQAERRASEREMVRMLHEGLSALPRVRLFNKAPAPVVSFHVDGIDAHRVALYLSERDIMCRSGYFCCHAYLQHRLEQPPLVRVSLGLHNAPADIDRFLSALHAILTTL